MRANSYRLVGLSQCSKVVIVVAAQNYWTSEHGKKFCSLYQIDRDSLPIVVIIDPRTGDIRQRLLDYLKPQDMIEKCTAVFATYSLLR